MANPPILVKPIPPQIVNEGAPFGPFNLNEYIKLQDQDGDSLQFTATLTSGATLPKGLTCTAEGIIQGIPAKGTQGVYDLAVVAENSSGTPLTAEFKLSIKERIAIETKEGLQQILQHAILEGLDTIGILAALLKLQYDANEIPSDDPTLLICLWLKYSLTRNEFLDELLEPLTLMDDGLNRINTSLVALEKVPEGKLSVPTFAKELVVIKDSVKKLKETREQTQSSYETFMRERDKVIEQVLQKVLKAKDLPERTRISGDQVVKNEFARVETLRKDLLFKLEKFTREKESAKVRLVDLFNKTQERMPVEQRTALPTEVPTTKMTSQQ